MDIKTHFSFLKLLNTIKGVCKPVPADQVDEEWLEKKAPKAYREKITGMMKWCDQTGVWHPKVKYPVMFGQGDSAFPGMLALEDIGPNENFVKVPSHLIISTAVAYRCTELSHIYYNHPEVFGKHVHLGDDNVLVAFLLYQLKLGTASRFYPMISTWPTHPDILMNWEDEDLEWLQDPTMIEDAEKGQEEFMEQWEALYRTLKQYPEVFDEKDIGMNRFRYVYILTTNRAFSSNWPGISQMVPFADFINHENVDTGFDTYDEEGKQVGMPTDEIDRRDVDEETRKQNAEKRNFIANMSTDLLELETRLRRKMEEEGHEVLTEEARND